MATATTTRTSRKAPKPPAGRCGLTMRINGAAYRVRPIRPGGGAATRAFRLTKGDRTSYDVAQLAHGAECDCPDFVFRRDGLDPAGCKHVRAARALGLLD